MPERASGSAPVRPLLPSPLVGPGQALAPGAPVDDDAASSGRSGSPVPDMVHGPFRVPMSSSETLSSFPTWPSPWPWRLWTQHRSDSEHTPAVGGVHIARARCVAWRCHPARVRQINFSAEHATSGSPRRLRLHRASVATPPSIIEHTHPPRLREHPYAAPAISCKTTHASIWPSVNAGTPADVRAADLSLYTYNLAFRDQFQIPSTPGCPFLRDKVGITQRKA